MIDRTNQRQRIRVGYLIDSTYRCGTAIHLFAVLRHLDRNRFQPWVAGLGEKGPVADDIRSLGIEVEEFGLSSVYSPATVRAVIDLARKVRQTRTAIVQSYLFFDNLIGVVAARLGGARAVITGRRTVDDWETPRHRFLYRLTNRWVDRIVVVSPEVQNSVLRFEGAAPPQVVQIANAQSRETLLARNDPSEETLLRAYEEQLRGAFVFGTVGNIRPIKGHDILVRAFHRMHQDHPDTHLVILGTGIMAEEVAGLVADLGLSDRVLLPGHVSSVARFVERFDAFVIPSRAEGMSNAMLEALILGKPVISTPFGLPRDSAGDEIVLSVEAGDETGLAAAMARIRRDDGLRRTLAVRAEAYARETMDEAAMVRAYEQLYEELL